MASPGPEAGLVIRYDFLWQSEHVRGQDWGRKDRPCAIVLATDAKPDGSRRVMVCAITHTMPDDPTTAIEIPAPVAKNLGLDGQRSWIRTHEVNVFEWEAGRLPFGVTQASRDRLFFGFLPPRLYVRVKEQVRAVRDQRRLIRIERDK